MFAQQLTRTFEVLVLTGTACLPGWIFNRKTSKCYKFSDFETEWLRAKMECELPIIPDPIDSQHKAHLVSITSKEENNFVSSLLQEGDTAWIGGTKLGDGSWIWIDGSVWSYENWETSPEEQQQEQEHDSLAMIKHDENARNGVWYGFHRDTNILPPSDVGYVCQYLAF